MLGLNLGQDIGCLHWGFVISLFPPGKCQGGTLVRQWSRLPNPFKIISFLTIQHSTGLLNKNYGLSLFAISVNSRCDYDVYVGMYKNSLNFYRHLSCTILVLHWLLTHISSCTMAFMLSILPQSVSQWDGIRSAESSVHAMICQVQVTYDHSTWFLCTYGTQTPTDIN
jgi:hypothetical protein